VGDKSGIEWTDATWNPVTGCTKVSQGCRNCYALRDWGRLSANPQTVYFGREFTDVQCHEERLAQPMLWKKPRRIFVNSMSDLFHAAVPDFFIEQVFRTMIAAEHHTYQILTKRAERMQSFLQARGWEPDRHIQIGVSCEDQWAWDERVPHLLATTASIRFVSLEPLLGPIDMRGKRYDDASDSWVVPSVSDWPLAGLQWVIVGGESGPAARPMNPQWVRDLRDQCALASVPFFFKQWGEWVSVSEVAGPGPHFTFPDHRTVRRVGKRLAGRALDGVTHDGSPTVET
jgi:protein gp37